MDIEMTPEEVRAYADKVQFGECITFPNGLVIDKRPMPQPVVSVPSVVHEMPIDTERQWSTDGPIPMDPESNWDICPVCRSDMKKLEWISVGLMRSRHNAHKAAEAIGTDPDSVTLRLGRERKAE